MNRNSNFAKKTSNFIDYLNNMSTERKVLVFIAVGIIMIILFYWAYNTRDAANKKMAGDYLITNYVNVNDQSTVVNETVNGSKNGNQMTISFWLNVNNYNVNSGQQSYELINITNMASILDISIDGTINNLNVIAGNINNFVQLENIPFYTWTHYVITLNNRIVNIYMNGTLIISKLVEFTPAQYSTYNVEIGNTGIGSFDATLSNVNYFAREITSDEVVKLFNQPPSLKKKKNKKNK
jgi:hypothetical protein